MVASTDQYFGLKINSNVVINCWGPPNLMTCKHVTLSRGFFEGANRVASIGLWLWRIVAFAYSLFASVYLPTLPWKLRMSTR